MTNSFEDYVEKKSGPVNRILEEATVSVIREPVKLLDESIQYALVNSSSSKRVRGAICMAACELVGGKDTSVVPAACAVEMAYISSCLVADLPRVRNNGIRWGKPANHKVYGESVTVLSGLALGSLAIEYLVKGCTELGLPPDRIVRGVGEIARFMGSDGLTKENKDEDNKTKNRNKIMEMLERMDAFMNLHTYEAELEGSLILGAILAGAEDQEIDRLREFARCIGPLLHLLDHADDREDTTRSSKPGKSKASDEKRSSVEDAKSHLAGFDPERAAPLMALADCLVELL